MVINIAHIIEVFKSQKCPFCRSWMESCASTAKRANSVDWAALKVDTHNTPAESAGVEVVALFESKVTQTCLVPGQAFSLLVGLEDGSIYYLCWPP